MTSAILGTIQTLEALPDAPQARNGVEMPSDIRIIHAHEFIVASPDGRLDLRATEGLLVEIASASAPSNDYDILLDTRGARSEMTETDLVQLACALRGLREAFSLKTAVLVPAGRFDHALFFAACAREEGFQVSAFTSLGDAMEWLVGTDL